MKDTGPPATLFALALQFLTRLPSGRGHGFSPERLAEATRWFPMVGVIVGALGAAAYLVAATLLTPTFAAIAATGVTVLATGALHEDGLADTADGLGGGSSREHALEIMRDSRIGTYGTLALGLTVAAQIALLASLPIPLAMAGLVAAHALSRGAVVVIMASMPYARLTGAGSFAAKGVSTVALVIAGATSLVVLLVLAWSAGLSAALTTCLLVSAISWAMARFLHRRLGGWTGDGLGCTQQLGLLAALVGLSVWV
ncbi:MAG: adenosylcobinamide-GDP ribazoletransferase [Pseudomonadota bacterium]